MGWRRGGRKGCIGVWWRVIRLEVGFLVPQPVAQTMLTTPPNHCLFLSCADKQNPRTEMEQGVDALLQLAMHASSIDMQDQAMQDAGEPPSVGPSTRRSSAAAAVAAAVAAEEEEDLDGMEEEEGLGLAGLDRPGKRRVRPPARLDDQVRLNVECSISRCIGLAHRNCAMTLAQIGHSFHSLLKPCAVVLCAGACRVSQQAGCHGHPLQAGRQGRHTPGWSRGCDPVSSHHPQPHPHHQRWALRKTHSPQLGREGSSMGRAWNARSWSSGHSLPGPAADAITGHDWAPTRAPCLLLACAGPPTSRARKGRGRRGDEEDGDEEGAEDGMEPGDEEMGMNGELLSAECCFSSLAMRARKRTRMRGWALAAPHAVTRLAAPSVLTRLRLITCCCCTYVQAWRASWGSPQCAPLVQWG